jgi:DNA-directed RNA polymerase subunit RPC12/RpoP
VRPRGLETPDLLVRRAIQGYRANNANTQEPMKSVQDGSRFRTVLDGFVPSSRTITRTELRVLLRERKLSICEPKQTQLVLFYSKDGKPLAGRCSTCGKKVRVRYAAPNSSEIEVHCPNCQASLMLVGNFSEMERSFRRAATLMKPKARKKRR